MENIINLYGNTGVGKTTLIKEFVFEKNTLILDFQGGACVEYKNTTNIVSIKGRRTKTNCLELLNNISNDYKYIFFENFTHIFPLIEKQIINMLLKNKQTFFIFVTHDKLTINGVSIIYFEIKNNSLVENNKQIFKNFMQ